MIIVGFYTADTPYEKEAEIWSESFKNYETCLYKVKNSGDWVANCAQKAKVLQYALKDLQDDILYLDVDARLGRPLEAIPNPELPGLCVWKPNWKPTEKELLSGTIYIPYNEVGIDLVDTWVLYQDQRPGVWDQKVLQEVVFDLDKPHFLFDLAWVYIDRFMKSSVKDPIIIHEQASRRLKKKV